eukprot:6449707-Amphidinium_carterae.1
MLCLYDLATALAGLPPDFLKRMPEPPDEHNVEILLDLQAMWETTDKPQNSTPPYGGLWGNDGCLAGRSRKASHRVGPLGFSRQGVILVGRCSLLQHMPTYVKH